MIITRNPTDRNPTACDRARRRLLRIGDLAYHIEPTVEGWAALHSEWARLWPVCAQSPDQAALHERVDAAIGGRGQP